MPEQKTRRKKVRALSREIFCNGRTHKIHSAIQNLMNRTHDDDLDNTIEEIKKAFAEFLVKVE